MSEVEQLLGLINSVLQSEDKDKRESAEKTLVSLRGANPNQLLLAFLVILAGQYETGQRNFSASQLRLNLSEFCPSTYTNLWPNLNPTTQAHIKTELFKILFNEQDQSMKKHIADTLGEIAGSILSKDINAWPEFKTNIWTLFQEPSGAGILPAFYVLETFLPFCPVLFQQNSKDLFVLFQSGLKHENNKIKLSSLNAFSSYLEILEPKDQKSFKLLTNDIYNTVYTLLSKDNNEQGLQNLSQMLEVDHKFFKNSFKELNQLLQCIFKIKDIQSGVKRMATEILVDYAQRSPSTFRKNKQYLNGLLHMIFIHMVQIDEDISQEWKKPEEGYNDDMEDDEDFETTRFGMGAIDRIIYAVGDKEVLPLLSQAIKQLLKNTDWRYQYTAIMALSQVGQYIQQATHISSIIQMILNYFSHQNPMLRYAACHAIGQISDDMKPKYQQLYGKQTYPKLVTLLKDPIPRVVSHSAAALTNFLEGMKYEECIGNMDQMMELFVFHASKGISLVKESCLGAVSSVAEICKENFAKYLEVTVQLLFNIIETHTTKQYKQLRGQAIETMTIIASSVGPVLFRPAVQKLVNIMIHIQESKFEQVDPQKSYILAGWQRLCLIYGQQLAGYLNRILPSLFQLVRNVINTQLNLVNNPSSSSTTTPQQQQDFQNGINTFQTQQAQVAISMLNVFIQQLKQLYNPYVQQTVTLLCKIIKEHLNDSVREEACKCLPSLVSAIKVTNKDGAITMTKYFMKTLVQTIEKESEPDIVCVELDTLKCVIEDLDLCFLTSQEIQEFSKKMLLMLNQSQETKQATHKYMKQGEELDEDQKNMFDEEIKQEQQVQVAISEVFGMLFKTHQDIALPIAEHLITQVLPSVLKPGLSENAYKFAIFMIDDMVEFLGYKRLATHWDEFGKVLLGFCQEKSVELRQAACYGLGIYAQNSPSNAAVIQSWLHAMIESSKIPKGSQKQKSYGHCRDNAISSIGKIIKSHGQFFNCTPVIQYWFNFLPLKFDKPQALIQHQFLMDIMLNKPQLILGTVPQSQLTNLTKLLHIYGAILNYHKIYNEQIKLKMKQHLLSLQNFPLFTNNQDAIWKQLGQKEKEALAKLVSG